jgi:hypothetical protein
MTKLMVAFRNFANAPEIGLFSSLVFVFFIYIVFKISKYEVTRITPVL